jgi:hypothetical protein
MKNWYSNDDNNMQLVMNLEMYVTPQIAFPRMS